MVVATAITASSCSKERQSRKVFLVRLQFKDIFRSAGQIERSSRRRLTERLTC
jgi:hypothetical protein